MINLTKSDTARITKEMHVHKPIKRTMMTYTGLDGKRQAHTLDMRSNAAADLVIRTLKWATMNGVEVTFRSI